jgi:hypothetical protein
MSSIDKLALTCRVLYDQRVLEQRKEIEKLEVKYFFRGYTPKYMKHSMEYLNYSNIRCKCRGCYTAERIIIDEEVDEEAACTFGPWFDNVLQERGLVVLRHQDHNFEYCEGPYDDLDRRFDFPNFVFDFNDEPLSSPPTPPASPKMAPQPPPPLRITTTIDQGLKLQELEKQLATQAAEIQTLKEQLATQAAETQLDRDDSKRKRP